MSIREVKRAIMVVEQDGKAFEDSINRVLKNLDAAGINAADVRYEPASHDGACLYTALILVGG